VSTRVHLWSKLLFVLLATALRAPRSPASTTGAGACDYSHFQVRPEQCVPPLL